MFRWKRKPCEGSHHAEPASTSHGIESYYDLDRDERRELLRALLEGMSPNPELRQQANETKQTFNDRYGNSDDD